MKRILFRANDGTGGPALWVTDGTLAGTQLVLDLRAGNDDASVSGFFAFRNKVLFTYDDGAHGSELWTTDGTAAGTSLLYDIAPGLANSAASRFTIFGDKVIFVASDATANAELWVTDGSSAGTYPLKDMLTGGSSNPANFVVLGDKLLFSANGDGVGTELWVSDGTAAGTRVLADIAAGAVSSNAGALVRIGAKVLFTANDGTNGTELWITDGTAAGTQLLKELNVGAGSVSSFGSTSLRAFGDKYVFTVNNGTSGTEPWITDGTAAGTFMLADIAPGTTNSNPGAYTVLGSKLIFSASDPTNGQELWITDGTAAGTSLLKDIRTGSTGSFPSSFTLAGSKAFFVANTGIGSELWITDGTTAGTVLVKDIRAGTGSSSPTGLTVLGSKVVFAANGFDVGGGIELWISDGTTAGTVLLKDIATSNHSSPSNFQLMDGKIVFTAYDETNGTELWSTDGTTAGTQIVNIPDTRTIGSGAGTFSVLGSKVIFSANDSTNGIELWASDGTAAGTALLKNINPGSEHALHNTYGFTQLGSRLIFSAFTAANGQEVWATDGTAAGTVLLKDAVTSPSAAYGSNPDILGVVGSRVVFSTRDDVDYIYNLWATNGTAAGTVLIKSGASGAYLTPFGTKALFQANDATNGSELWVTDGTAAGTVLLKNLEAGIDSSYPNSFRVLGTKAIFTATTVANGRELWVTDGTAAGTVLLKDINPGAGSSLSEPTSGRVVGGKYYFAANDGVNGLELWVTDGTSAGTVLVKDIKAGVNGSGPDYFTAWGSKLVFLAQTAGEGQELWISDGTAAGTFMLADIAPGTANSNANGFTVFGSKLLFTANGPEGYELWNTDGTAAGTTLLADIEPGTASSNPGWFTALGSKLIFSARTVANGQELWVTDGTAAGTTLLKDINPGTHDSSPTNFTLFGSKLVFSADDGVKGTEMWVTDGTAAGTMLLKDVNTVSPGASPSSLFSFSITNTAPAGLDATITVIEDQRYTLTLRDFFYADAEGHALSRVQIVTAPSQGSLLLDTGPGGLVAVATGQWLEASDIANGRLTFQGAPGQSGVAYASFTFRILDAGGTANGGADTDLTANTVTINVTPNRPPVLDNPIVDHITAEDAPFTYTLRSDTFSDPDGDALAYSATLASGDPLPGWLAFNAGTRTFSGSPPQDHSAAYSIRVTASDGTESVSDDFDLTIYPLDDAPAHSLPPTIFTSEETPVVMNNGVAVDPPPAWIADADSATITTTLSAIDGTFTSTGWGGALVTGSGSNQVTITGSPDEVNRTVYFMTSYQPALNVTGSRTLTVETTDGTNTTSGTITVSISPTIDTPEGLDVTRSATEDTPYILQASDFGFSDPDGDSLAAIQIASAPLHGRLVDIGGYGVDITGDGDPEFDAPERDLDAGDYIDLSLLASGYYRYIPAANAFGVGTDSFTYQVVDDGAAPFTSGTVDPTPNTMTFDIAGVNDVPTLADFATVLTVIEGDGPTPLDAEVTFTDPEDNFDNGTLVVSGVLVEEQVAIADAGPGPGQIGLSGSDITYGGLTIGSFTGGIGVDLAVTFNANATAEAIEALIASLTYFNSSDAPTASRTLTVTVTDAASDQTSQNIDVTVMPLNDAPSFTSSSPEPSYTEGDPYVAVAPDVTVSDPDSADFDGGSFTIALTSGGHPGDVVGLAIATTPGAGLYVQGTDLYHDGVLIGAFTAVTADSVTITLNAAATAAMIEELTEAVVFTSSSEDPTDIDRVITFTFTDGDGGSTDLVRTIGVTSVNDAPVVSIPGVQTTAEDTTLVFSAANGNAITVADDGSTVTLDLSSQSLNLVPRGTITLAGTTGITFISGADGTGAMQISGTPADINAALDGLTYTPRADLHDDISVGSDLLRVAVNDTGTPSLIDVEYVTIEVTAAEDTTPGTLTIDEDSGPNVIDVLANTSFEDPARFLQTVSADYGRIDIDDNGTADPDDDTIVYTPDTDFNGTDVIHYYVFAGEFQEEGTITVTVNSINDAPVFGRTAFDMRIVSVSDAGESANQNVYDVSFSADGRYVVFASAADNLVAGDANGSMDVFVRDLLDGTTTRYSTSTSGVEGNNDSYQPTLSPDGTLLVFSSTSSDLVADDTNNADDLFLKDLGTGVTTRVVAENGDEPDSSSPQASFSPDGTKLLFVSSASNLVAGDTNGVDDVFVLTIATGEIERVSTDSAGAESNGGATEAVWSPDGTSIAFSSDADNLVAGDTNGSEDVFVKDLATGVVTRVSTDETGAEADDNSSSPVFSPDGSSIAFVSRATNLLAAGVDTNDSRDIYLKDLTTGEIRRVSVDGTGAELDNDSHSPAFSPDGTHVAFVSQATNAVPGDIDNQDDLFVVDLSDGSIVLVGDPATSDDFDGEVRRGVFSPDGSQILFTSEDGGLATPDTTGKLRALLATLEPQNAVFVENGPSVQVVPLVSLTDDGDNYGGGTLTIAITAGGAFDDELTLDVPSSSTGVGLERNGTDFSFDGVLIGWLGGSPTSLEFTLTADATDTAVAKLAEAVRFANTGESPTSASRTVTFTLVDGSGDDNGGSDTGAFEATVEVTEVNDAPDLDLEFAVPGDDTAVTYTAGDPPTYLAYNAEISDDNMSWNGASLTVTIAGATADDQLSIESPGDAVTGLWIDGNDIYYDGALVGTFTGGDDGNPLAVTFNALACECAVTEVTYRILYENSGTITGASSRDVTFLYDDGQGGSDSAVSALTLAPG
ncbi:MAG TPA: ELWxxDGT repeat protein, partial [Croceibacterium sp.]